MKGGENSGTPPEPVILGQDPTPIRLGLRIEEVSVRHTRLSDSEPTK